MAWVPSIDVICKEKVRGDNLVIKIVFMRLTASTVDAKPPCGGGGGIWGYAPP